MPNPPSQPDPSSATSYSTTGSTSASQLPPAALELASRLFDYAREGNTPLLSQYLNAGIPPNLTNHAGDTILMLAAYHGHAATVAAILAKGADPNVLNDRGQSPLAGAVFKGYEDVVRALVEAGADPLAGQPNAKDSARMFRRDDLFGVLGVTDEDQATPLPGLLIGPGGRPEATGSTDGG